MKRRTYESKLLWLTLKKFLEMNIVQVKSLIGPISTADNPILELPGHVKAKINIRQYVTFPENSKYSTKKKNKYLKL